MYHASAKSATRHQNVIHVQKTNHLNNDLVRLTRITARRANKLPCDIRCAKDDKDLEWLNEANVDTGGLTEKALEIRFQLY